MVEKKLLLNYVYWMPVGHAIESIKYARGLYEANKNIEVSIALNSSTPIEIVKNISWIKKVYSVDLESIENSVNKIPKKWDFIVQDSRSKKLGNMQYEKKMKSYYSLFEKRVISKNPICFTNELRDIQNISGLKYRFHTKIDLEIPKKSLEFSKKIINKSKIKISVMLAGSAKAGEYPSIDSWIKIFEEINKKIKNVEFYITGVDNEIKNRTSTKAFSKKDRDKIFEKIPNAKDCYNIGLWNQIALLKKSNVFISPHTGFAFLAPSVGTPWLAISGGDWPEYLFNKVSFYSVLPKTKEYPFYASKTNIKKLPEKECRKVTWMDEKGIAKRLPEIIFGIKKLLDKKFTFEKAIRQHIKNIGTSKINKDVLFFFEMNEGFKEFKQVGKKKVENHKKKEKNFYDGGKLKTFESKASTKNNLFTPFIKKFGKPPIIHGVDKRDNFLKILQEGIIKLPREHREPKKCLYMENFLGIDNSIFLSLGFDYFIEYDFKFNLIFDLELLKETAYYKRPLPFICYRKIVNYWYDNDKSYLEKFANHNKKCRAVVDHYISQKISDSDVLVFEFWKVEKEVFDFIMKYKKKNVLLKLAKESVKELEIAYPKSKRDAKEVYLLHKCPEILSHKNIDLIKSPYFLGFHIDGKITKKMESLLKEKYSGKIIFDGKKIEVIK